MERFEIDELFKSRAGLDEWQALSQGGNFEALFRGLRRILEEMVAAPPEWEAVLTDASLSVEPLIGHKYWAVAFDLFFHDAMLLAMFGPHAVQHAEPGSYPRYFQRVFEAGLQRLKGDLAERPLRATSRYALLWATK